MQTNKAPLLRDSRLRNKWWRLCHLYKIKNKAGELVTFYPNIIQLKHIADRASHRYNRVLKARQFGFTTFYCIDYLDEALWVPGTSCAIIAHERIAIEGIFQIVKRAYFNLPDELKPMVKTDTQYMYRFTHSFDGIPLDSSIYVALKLRSGTVQKLHISEAAYIKDWGELVSGSKQAVPKTGTISEESTGNGYNDFYDAFMASYYNQSITPMDYRGYFYPWQDNPEYTLPGTLTDDEKETNEIAMQSQFNLTDGQLLWRRWKKNELKVASIGEGLSADQLFKQEYPMTIQEAFQSGVGGVFDPARIDAVKLHMPLQHPAIMVTGTATDVQNQALQALVTMGVKFWYLPEPGVEYTIGVDPSDGEGADFSCIDVWQKEPIRQVCQYYGKLRPDELAELTKQIAEFYNRAFTGVENNMLTTILFLSKIYDNYYYDTRIDEKTLKRTKKIGWNTNLKTRDVMIDEFNILFDEGNLEINSQITLSEMRTFVKKDNGKREHADGKHDDALIGGMIAIQMRKLRPAGGRVFATNPFG